MGEDIQKGSWLVDRGLCLIPINIHRSGRSAAGGRCECCEREDPTKRDSPGVGWGVWSWGRMQATVWARLRVWRRRGSSAARLRLAFVAELVEPQPQMQVRLGGLYFAIVRDGSEREGRVRSAGPRPNLSQKRPAPCDSGRYNSDHR